MILLQQTCLPDNLYQANLWVSGGGGAWFSQEAEWSQLNVHHWEKGLPRREKCRNIFTLSHVQSMSVEVKQAWAEGSIWNLLAV